jgi:hypothetical protein
MTQAEFDSYKLQIQYIISQKAEKIANYLAIGRGSICNDIVNLEFLVTYMDVMQTYDLEPISVGDDDTVNYFTRDEMQDFVTKINTICGTHYNVDFILET